MIQVMTLLFQHFMSLWTNKWNVQGIAGICLISVRNMMIDMINELAGALSVIGGLILLIMAIYKKWMEILNERERLKQTQITTKKMEEDVRKN